MTRRGFTVVEIIVVSFIVAIAIGFGVQLMVRGFSAEKSIGGKVQVVHDAQIASVRLSEILHDATELFAPAVGLDDTRPFAVFASQSNEMMLLYLDDKSRLVMSNRNTREKQVLASNVSRFRAYRRGRRLLNYHLTFKDPQSGELLDLLGGVCIRNDQN